MDNRKNWTSRQDLLRKALASKPRFVEAIALFHEQHAAVHTAQISNPHAWSLHDEVLTGLSGEQIQTIPAAGQNSIAWLLWHITRIEDMTINTLTMDQAQVWNKEWSNRLGYKSPDCGAGMNDDEVATFSAAIIPEVLLEYRAAVGLQTRLSIDKLTVTQSREIVPDPIVQRLVEEGSINANANWLYEFYTHRTRAFFLTRTATSHNFIHLNEAGRVAKKLFKR